MKVSKRLIGARIKSIRESKRLTQEKLSERVDINPVYLSNIERGMANPTLDLFLRLAKGLDVEIWELFDFGHEVSPPELKKVLSGFVKDMDEEKLQSVVKVVRAMVR